MKPMMDEYYALSLDNIQITYLGRHDSFDAADEESDRRKLGHVWLIDRTLLCQMLKSGITALNEEAESHLA